MNIEGLDYNTQREQLILPEYGREVQNMVDYALSLPDKEERQRCAESIIVIMDRMFPQNHENPDYKQKLWDHLAIMSNFQLDIDWPYDISGAAKIATKPEPLEYPMTQIPVRHYGKMLFDVFEHLKTMPAGEERDELVRQTANQMKRDLYQWSHGSADDEKIASDLARFTDGRIQLDLDTFTFEKLDMSQMQQQTGKKKRR
ncbi:MAG: DUF4290 domain-containing protein [Prevotella sp.]|nr:DUF4290 domain-containing protein [Prevotella sp.]